MDEQVRQEFVKITFFSIDFFLISLLNQKLFIFLGSRIVSVMVFLDKIWGRRGRPIYHAAKSQATFQIIFKMFWTQDLNIILLMYESSY